MKIKYEDLDNYNLFELKEIIKQLNEENKNLKEKHFLIQGDRFNNKTYITNLEKENENLKEELKNRPILDFTFDTYKELEDYKSKCEKIENNCIKSIESINKKLKENRELLYKTLYLNDYQVLRLKAIRMKCKEILRLIRGE